MNPLPPSFDIRYSTPEDLSYLTKWFADPKEREPFFFQTDSETEDALKNWIGFSRFKASLTGILQEEPCAIGTLFLMPYRKVAHHCSFFLIVDPLHRNKGVGKSLVRNLLHLAKTRFRLESVHVEVMEGNPLLSLLKKEKFELFATQERFYKLGGAYRSRHLLEHFFQEPK